MTSDRKAKASELNRLYELFWKSRSALDQALVRAKIGMVAAELAKFEMTDTPIPLTDRSGTVK